MDVQKANPEKYIRYLSFVSDFSASENINIERLRKSGM